MAKNGIEALRARKKFLDDAGIARHLLRLDPNRVRPNPKQPRKLFRGIDRLARSIKQHGQLQPVLVEQVDDDPNHDYQLVFGERRLLACIKAKVKILAVPQGACDAKTLLILGLVENLHRDAQNPMETAGGLREAISMGSTVNELAEELQHSLPWVTNHLNLLKLSPVVQKLLIPGGEEESAGNKPRTRLPMNYALMLIKLKPEKQEEAAAYLIEHRPPQEEARRYVESIARAGSPSGSNEAIPVRQGHRSLPSILRGAIASIGRFNDLPIDDFRRAFANASDEEVATMGSLIGKLRTDLENLRSRLITPAKVVPLRPGRSASA